MKHITIILMVAFLFVAGIVAAQTRPTPQRGPTGAVRRPDVLPGIVAEQRKRDALKATPTPQPQPVRKKGK